MTSSLSFSNISFLVQQGPMLLVYLVGLVLALVYMRKNPLPALLTLVSMGILLLTTVLLVGLQMFLMHTQLDRGEMDLAEYARLMSVIGIAGGFVRALGTGLLLAAVFVGRGQSGGRPHP